MKNRYSQAKIPVLSYGAYDYVIVSLEEILATEDDSGVVYFVDVDLAYTNTIKIKHFNV